MYLWLVPAAIAAAALAGVALVLALIARIFMFVGVAPNCAVQLTYMGRRGRTLTEGWHLVWWPFEQVVHHNITWVGETDGKVAHQRLAGSPQVPFAPLRVDPLPCAVTTQDATTMSLNMWYEVAVDGADNVWRFLTTVPQPVARFVEAAEHALRRSATTMTSATIRSGVVPPIDLADTCARMGLRLTGSAMQNQVGSDAVEDARRKASVAQEAARIAAEQGKYTHALQLEAIQRNATEVEAKAEADRRAKEAEIARRHALADREASAKHAAEIAAADRARKLAEIAAAAEAERVTRALAVQRQQADAKNAAEVAAAQAAFERAKCEAEAAALATKSRYAGLNDENIAETIRCEALARATANMAAGGGVHIMPAEAWQNPFRALGFVRDIVGKSP
jgi:hypothetical protein